MNNRGSKLSRRRVMSVRMSIGAKHAWYTVWSIVIGYDLYCLLFRPPGQTMSEEVDTWVERRPIATRIFFVLLAAHIANLTPPKYDVVHHGAVFIGGPVRQKLARD
ncbi:hypothetical protein SEA_JONJAMES_171 [Gordonia Phage JonJames]|nr:hypothetical protein SEA_JONJAMES_171 [Gordonia Phage JonJames]